MASTALPDEQVTSENNNNDCKDIRQHVVDALQNDHISKNDDITNGELFDFDSSDLDENSDSNVNEVDCEMAQIEKNEEKIDEKENDEKMEDTSSATSTDNNNSFLKDAQNELNVTQSTINESPDKNLVNSSFADDEEEGEEEPIFDFLGKSNEIVCELIIFIVGFVSCARCGLRMIFFSWNGEKPCVADVILYWNFIFEGPINRSICHLCVYNVLIGG